MKNAHEEHDIMSKKAFKRNSINKINLQGMRKINIKFQRWGKINCLFLFILRKISKLTLNSTFKILLCFLLFFFFCEKFNSLFVVRVKLQKNHKFINNIVKIKTLATKS